MKCIVILAAALACSGADHVKRETAIVAPAYYTLPTAYSSQYVATPLVSSAYTPQYVAAPVVSSAYVAAPNPVIARASRILGEPGFVSRYVAAPVAAPVAAVETVETLATPAKLVTPAVAPVATVRSVAAPSFVAAAPAKYTVLV